MTRTNTLKIFLLTLVCINLTVMPVLSQPEGSAFDSIFYHTYMNTASIDLNRALEVADSLYRTSGSDIRKVRSLMLISDMHHRTANRDSTIHYALKADRIATGAGLYDWQARICGVLSTQYRLTGLLNQGRVFLEKGLRISEKIESPAFAAQFKGHVYQEKGFYALEERQYRAAVSLFNQADNFFRELPDSPERAVFRMQNEERLGRCYLKLQVRDSARYHYTRALEFAGKISDEETPVLGFTYQGLGQVNLESGNDSAAYEYLSGALSIAETSGFPDLQIDVYKSLAQYYRTTGEVGNYVFYNEKYLELAEENIGRQQRYADNIVFLTQQKLEEMTASRKMILLGGVVLLFIGVPAALFYRKKQQSDYKRFQQIIRELRERDWITGEPTPQEWAEADPYEGKAMMPEKTERSLLEKLKYFENTGEFREKSISLSVLAGKMGTNTKYLSYLIHKHEQKDFNAYINELRIRYILRKMQEDRVYMHYKISYLAEECGFSSHSKFSTVFKDVVGLSPSAFTACLKKDQEQKAGQDYR